MLIIPLIRLSRSRNKVKCLKVSTFFIKALYPTTPTLFSGDGEVFCRRALLSLVVVLGLVAGIAFSASYQLVARFANKNTISLGLGCVGSGIVTLIVETALRMGATPSHKQELILFEATAGMFLLLHCFYRFWIGI